MINQLDCFSPIYTPRDCFPSQPVIYNLPADRFVEFASHANVAAIISPLSDRSQGNRTIASDTTETGAALAAAAATPRDQ